MIKKILSFLILSLFTVNTVFAVTPASDDTTVENFKGLERNPVFEKTSDGSHTRFDNVYIKDGNLRAIKGRQRLNTTAHSDAVVNGFFYYRNQANSVEKLIVAESDEIVSYDLDGTNRTSLASSLTNSSWDATQIGDSMYLMNETNGLYLYTGGGSATAITGVTAPSSVTFSSSTNAGGMTPGENVVVAANIVTDGTCDVAPDTNPDEGCVCLNSTGDCFSADAGGENVTSDSGTLETAATSSTYRYKVVSYSTKAGIESEPSASTSVTLTGDPNFSWNGTNCTACDSGGGDGINFVPDATCCTGIDYATSGRRTSTTGSLATPSAPFDVTRVYRSVVGGANSYFFCIEDTGSVTDGTPDSALGHPLDTTIDTIEDPDFKYIENYKGTIFTAEGSTLRFNRVPIGLVTSADKYWLDTDKLTVGTEKNKVTGLAHTSNSLLIFTASSVQELTGFGVSSFRLSTIIDGIGTVSDRSVITDTNGDIIFFAGNQGVYKLKVGQQATDNITGASVGRGGADLVRISSPALDSIFNGTDSEIILSASDYATSNAYYDLDNDLYHLFIGSEEFIFDAKHATWSHVKGIKSSASIYIKRENTSGQGYFLDDLGYMYKNWIGYTTSVQSGTVTGNPTSSTASTLTDSLAAFYTTDDGLKGQWVVLDNGTSLQYRRISSNTGTELTVSPNWTVNPVTTDTYYVGYIVADIVTKRYNFFKAPNEALASYFILNHNKAGSTQNIEIRGMREKNPENTYQNPFTIDLSQRFTDKVGITLRSTWTQWRLRTFVYNTSDTINPPLDIENYTITVKNQGHA